MTIHEAIANNIGSVITGCVAILSACITAGVALLVSNVNHKRSLENEKRKEKIERLERLYIDFECWSQYLQKIYICVSYEFKGGYSADDMNKKMENMNSAPKDKYPFIEATINLHHGELLGAFENVIAQKSKVGKYILGEKKSSLLNPFIDEQDKFSVVCNNFKNSIIIEMNRLTM
ncbi:hypothetical protein [Aeromonas encheleia]|uniref:Uncharacterized protein n=1 Tax=Aeromonas encheleia TaxID=73010 RepID=A0AAE9MDM3_9GAMM|nr:hypothetical protein [Aeromonas encheleia]USV55843.1 hypothetical protein NHF51_10705 [Aeromonas encheleia]